MSKWHKSDIALIINTLMHTPRMFHKGILFMWVNAADPDPLTQYFCPMVFQGSGAVTCMISRPILDAFDGKENSDGIKFILENTDATIEQIPAVIFDQGLYTGTAPNVFPFMLAHEVGHIEHGDILVGNEVVVGSAEYHQREVLADAFANNLLGSNQQGVLLMNRMLAFVNNADYQKLTGNNLEHAEMVRGWTQFRLDAMTIM